MRKSSFVTVLDKPPCVWERYEERRIIKKCVSRKVKAVLIRKYPTEKKLQEAKYLRLCRLRERVFIIYTSVRVTISFTCIKNNGGDIRGTLFPEVVSSRVMTYELTKTRTTWQKASVPYPRRIQQSPTRVTPGETASRLCVLFASPCQN